MVLESAPSPLQLREALDNRAVKPFFQPIVLLESQQILGLEVLARWLDPVAGTVKPESFIPVADKYGMLDELLDQLMREAFSCARKWPQDIFLGCNAAPSQLLDPGLLDRIQEAAYACEFPLTRLHIEVTESALMHDMAQVDMTLQAFIHQGCMIAMDDFGTGYSSLVRLNALPFSEIKIDTQFISTMLDKRQSRKIVEAVIGLGHSLGLAVVAEGVETARQAELLVKMGCQLAQGFLFGQPLPAQEVPTLFAARQDVTIAPTTQVPQMSAEMRALQLQDLYDSEQTAIAFSNASGTIIASSKAFNNLMLESGTVIGNGIEDLLNFTPSMLAELRAGDLTNRSLPAFECKTPRGSLALIIMRPVRDEDFQLVGFSVVCLDISSRQSNIPPSSIGAQPFRQSMQAEEQYSWQLSADGLVMSIDGDNAAAAANAGLAEGVALGAGWVDFVHPDDLGGALRGYAEAIATGLPQNVDLRLHKRGRRLSLVSHLHHSSARREERHRKLIWLQSTADDDYRGHAGR